MIKFYLLTDDEKCFHSTDVTDASNAGLMLLKLRTDKINSNLVLVTGCGLPCTHPEGRLNASQQKKQLTACTCRCYTSLMYIVHDLSVLK